MEEQFFTWKNWDQTEEAMAFLFSGCTLKSQLGTYPVGTRVEIILLNYGTGKMEFKRKSGPTKDGHTPTEVVASFNLSITAWATS